LNGSQPDDLIFPNSKGLPLSDMTLTKVMRDAKAPYTVHGFRSSFRDWAAEKMPGMHDAAEAALAHVVQNKVERAYMRTKFIEMRRELLEAWAGYVSGLNVTGSGPGHAIMLSEAWRVLWTRLAANAGLNSDGNWLNREEQATQSDPAAADASREHLFSALQDDAHIQLEGYIAVSRIRVWQSEGKEWRLIPPEWALVQFMTRTQESVRFLIDKAEFESDLLARHPPRTPNLSEDTASLENSSASGTNRPRGRPPGKKYAASDALLVAEMRDLLQTGNASSPTDASNQLAHKAEGPATLESKAKRLRDAHRDAFEAERIGV